ncbi:MAG TPA: hypothetical protein VEA79_07055 [Phenylobacterium sp.]|nr:hypothetical protein [Phenylobacterium sp.]
MEDLFRQFWWLLFPLFGMGMGAYGMWTSERRRRDTIELLKVYAQKGEEPPAALMKAVSASPHDGWGWGESSEGPKRRSYSDWHNVVLFLSLGVAFTFAALYGPHGADWAFVMVAIIMGGLAIGSLIVALLKRRDDHR